MEDQALVGKEDQEDGSVSDASSEGSPFAPKLCKQPFSGRCAMKWILPGFCWGFSCFICMWLLHIATYYYIRVMDRQTAAFNLAPTFVAGTSSFLSPSVNETEVSFGSNQDPMSGYLGFVKIDISILDKISAALPAAWFLTTIWVGDVQHWTKIITCNCMLAVLKGVFGLVTVVPDSSGWANCKARLGDENLNFFRTQVPDPATAGFMSTSATLLKMEICGPNCDRLSSGVRFCSDMMFSGHTYFTCLYALALIELVRWHVKKCGGKTFQTVVICVIMAVAVIEQCVEGYLVLLNRFHYTSDILMAIILTLLFYTNGTVCVLAKWWAHFGDAEPAVPEIPDDLGQDHHVVSKQQLHSEGDLWIPVCCVPFCCLWGRHHVISDSSFLRAGGDRESARVDLEAPVSEDGMQC